MKNTGVVRRIDDLGRLVIPKEIRRGLRLKDGDSLEIFVDNMHIILKKTSILDDNLSEVCKIFSDSLYEEFNEKVLIVDRDTVISYAGDNKKAYLKKNISDDVSSMLQGRVVVIEEYPKEISIVSGVFEIASYVIAPIISNGDVIGGIIIFANEHSLSKQVINSAIFTSKILSKYVD